ncbi:YitT family protein [Ammoniphilus sp. CFH 90114]|uniref:YczE/YyaS/YitT family protein n=1 Tax=Ammoniphilus sp. CFH 90114 TaxID=2493665 RepID=UPI00100E79A6|nr:YitT family protein [Ammoniphilus sp. CFH 90114]RXT03884.1 YitT family protein [Ammoniphilus sp. CFH 90114]
MNLRRFTFYTLGILILTLGIALSILSNLGTGPFDAVLVGLYRSFGMTIGSWEIVLGLFLVLCNAVAEKRRPEFLALLTSFITGIGIDFWMYLLGDWLLPETIQSRIFLLAMGMVIGGLGIAVNLQANWAPNPMDRSMQVVTKLTGFNFAISRALISIVLVFIAFIFSGPIGVGTILSTLFTGVIINWFMPFVERLDKKPNHSQQSLSS